jgi:tetratricopeptide (TPR) repeat protein
LQQASAATQQWNEFLKGLVSGYNSCAITNQQYTDSLKRIYPRLREDAAGLEEIRKVVSEGRKADETRLKSLLDSYFANLRQFAGTSGGEIIIERIAAVVEKSTDRVLERLDELERNLKQTPIATPAEVKKEVGAIKEKLLAKADEAQAAYDKGYALYQRYRFAEAIPFLKEALKIIPLPEFSLALGNAYLGLPDLAEAETTYTEGLRQSINSRDEKHEAIFNNELGLALLAKGDLDAALGYT